MGGPGKLAQKNIFPDHVGRGARFIQGPLPLNQPMPTNAGLFQPGLHPPLQQPPGHPEPSRVLEEGMNGPWPVLKRHTSTTPFTPRASSAWVPTSITGVARTLGDDGCVQHQRHRFPRRCGRQQQHTLRSFPACRCLREDFTITGEETFTRVTAAVTGSPPHAPGRQRFFQRTVPSGW